MSLKPGRDNCSRCGKRTYVLYMGLYKDNFICENCIKKIIHEENNVPYSEMLAMLKEIHENQKEWRSHKEILEKIGMI